ncbi:MAG: bifunctional phosphopantothenoylcysteine decarboxylase/phosphopantothenate--cysteine ligase CoaBC [Gallicola sp.]|nr:bifunctional phosphopantothenoylcysteine decarboxylase/phosphopantothenate--cysteine ligase CoaBC [Gallicola sp.]
MKKILLGISAGIAIYKVCDLVSRLIKRGYELEIIMTEDATKLVSPLVFETMGRCRVYTEMFHEGHHAEVEHIELATRADVFLIAPATGNTMAKIAHGIADNLLTAAALAYTKPIHFAVTMNTNMLLNPATQDNIAVLKKRGHEFIESSVGDLACNTFGDGRMAEPEEIADYIDGLSYAKDLKGKRIIVTAGPTQERIDPVRYLTNDSSGKMGYSIAKKAILRGADVVLITGPVSLEKPKGCKVLEIKTTEELLKSLDKEFPSSDALIMAAAPSDYRIPEISKEKIKKTGQGMEIKLIENPDILAEMGRKKKDQLIIGFAAETENVIENGKKKLKKKNADYIIANDVSREDAGFNVDTNIATILSEKEEISLEKMSKLDLADKILDLLKDEK